MSSAAARPIRNGRWGHRPSSKHFRAVCFLLMERALRSNALGHAPLKLGGVTCILLVIFFILCACPVSHGVPPTADGGYALIHNQDGHGTFLRPTKVSS